MEGIHWMKYLSSLEIIKVKYWIESMENWFDPHEMATNEDKHAMEVVYFTKISVDTS